MKPHIHAESSAKTYGGKPSDYLEIHKFLDSSKAHLGDCRHRAILHSTFGCYIAELVFGETLTNSDNKTISVREICEQHIIEDLGMLPTVQDWLTDLPIQSWMIRKAILDSHSEIKNVEVSCEQTEIEHLKEEIQILKERVSKLENNNGLPNFFPIEPPIDPSSPFKLPPDWPDNFPTIRD